MVHQSTDPFPPGGGPLKSCQALSLNRIVIPRTPPRTHQNPLDSNDNYSTSTQTKIPNGPPLPQTHHLNSTPYRLLLTVHSSLLPLPTSYSLLLTPYFLLLHLYLHPYLYLYLYLSLLLTPYSLPPTPSTSAFPQGIKPTSFSRIRF